MRTVTRRRFMGAVTAGGGGLVTLLLATPIIGFLVSPVFRKRQTSWVTVGPIDDVPVGIPTPRVVDVPTGEGWDAGPTKRIVYLTKLTDGRFKAFSNICTHMQCDVHWDPQLNLFLCPCHGGLYGIDGSNVGGPPPSPLPQWVSRLEKDASGRTILSIQNSLDESI
jgi:menaquinol-cytochrome c reductase iron-sulfur subunit